VGAGLPPRLYRNKEKEKAGKTIEN